jgi:hypothetical protein
VSETYLTILVYHPSPSWMMFTILCRPQNHRKVVPHLYTLVDLHPTLIHHPVQKYKMIQLFSCRTSFVPPSKIKIYGSTDTINGLDNVTITVSWNSDIVESQICSSTVLFLFFNPPKSKFMDQLIPMISQKVIESINPTLKKMVDDSLLPHRMQVY